MELRDKNTAETKPIDVAISVRSCLLKGMEATVSGALHSVNQFSTAPMHKLSISPLGQID